MPLETEFGRKRTIDQSSCNKDFSCVKGFCPSFVTVHGGRLARQARRRARTPAAFAALPEPPLPALDRALRHPDHRHRRHRRRHHRRDPRHGRASRGQGLHRARHDRPGAEGRRGDQPCAHRAASPRTSTPCASPPAAPTCCSAATWSSRPAPTALATAAAGPHARRSSTRHETITGDFTPQSRLRTSRRPTLKRLDRRRPPGAERCRLRRRAPRIATALLGDSIATNLFMLGYRLPEGPGPGLGRGHRARDRAQRRRRRARTSRPSAGAAAPRIDRAAVEARRRGEPAPPQPRDLARRSTRSSPRASST